jgi:hypothetical protein
MLRGRILAIAAAGAFALVACRGKGGTRADGGIDPVSVAAAVGSLVGFEGEIEIATTAPASAAPAPATARFRVKRGRMRVEFPTATVFEIVVIVDSPAQKAYWLSPATHSFVEAPLGQASGSAPGLALLKTGKSSKVAGYACDELQFTDPVTHLRTVACVSSGLAFIGLGGGPMKDFGFGSWMEAVGARGFPLRAETFDASGAIVTKVEATKIDKKSEPDMLFQVPANYRSSSAPARAGSPAPSASAAPAH